MPLPRLHLLELEDQPWFPAVVRDRATDYLHWSETKFALHRPVMPLLAEALRATGCDRVIDLCSGGAGPIPALRRELLAAGLDVRFTLTDKFPNRPAFEVAAAADPAIDFVPDPVDAAAVPAHLTGFRTVFNGFHHFRPAAAVAVLRDAAAAGQPIGVFEVSDRRLATILPMAMLVPPVVALATPFIRPFRWDRLVLTYLLPLVPLTCWWDGLVSQLRAYTVAELEGLAAQVGVAGYEWKAGTVPMGVVPGRLTYLIGRPPGFTPCPAPPPATG